ncbi:MAG TPA: hypothetical protein VM711_08240 [Sphingomicrobium sp.]|nr:hypothetical protein [Sphingomicrobium sp.]
MIDRFSPHRLAGWFLPSAIASVLFMGLGCVSLVMRVMANPARLPLDQRVLLEAQPTLVISASAFGFVAGLIGALLLLFRRKESERALMISLMGMVVWFAGLFVAPAFRDLLSIDEIGLSLIVVALTGTIFWFARHSSQRGWLH